MAILHPTNLQFTGSLNNLSAYTMRGTDKIILRSKGGAKKHQIEKDPSFEPTRNLNNEWKAVTKSAMEIRNGLFALSPMADHNISGPLNALVKKIQTMDTGNQKGKRAILFSHRPDFLSSFNYNRQNIFDSVIRQPLSVSIDKSSGVVDVNIPLLQPAINFFPHPRYVYYRIIMACTSVSDYVVPEGSNDYHTLNSQLPEYPASESAWALANTPQPAAGFQLAPANKYLPGPDMVFVFGAGIQYGMPGADGSIQPVPYTGAARILNCV